MNVKIITKHSAYNFGAMLQSYALQKTMERMGADCEILDLRQNKPTPLYPWNSPVNCIKNLFFFRYKKDILEGYERFESFISAYKKTERYESGYDIKGNVSDTDIYIAGSDQVWNPLNINDAFFLRFAQDSAIRASYAASIGVSYMPEGAKNIFKEYLADMDYISVREETAKNILSDLTDKKISVNVDPVFLLSKEEWMSIGKAPELNEPYILCYVLYRPVWLNKWLKKLHKATGKKIVLVTTDGYRNVYHNIAVRNAGPLEFLGLIQNADFVISSSFHGTALAIANNKPFYAVVNPSQPSRISDMLKLIKLDNRIIDETKQTVLEDMDFNDVNEIIAEERNKSKEYLNEIITSPINAVNKEELKNNTVGDNIETVGDKCTACRVCEKVCPVNAICFKKDEEGFLYPVVDKEKCIHCGLCLKKCHTVNRGVNSKESCGVYYGWHKDEKVRHESSSGGAFTALSNYVLSKGGLVVAAYFDPEQKKVCHATSDDVDMDRLRKSKYAESEMGTVLYSIEKALDEKRNVLFCGTPCQCAGVHRLFGENDKLIICDFLCHGVPSAKVFKDYLVLKEKKWKRKITDYRFRTKQFGWSQHGIQVKYDNNKTQDTVGRCEWFFVVSLIDDLFLRKSCYTCDKAVYHESDITIGDFWGIFKYKPEINDNKGISLIFTNNEKGEILINKIKSEFEVFETEKKYADYAFKIKTGDKKLIKRNKEFNEYTKIGIEQYIKKKYKLRMFKYRAAFSLKKSKLRGGIEK